MTWNNLLKTAVVLILLCCPFLLSAQGRTLGMVSKSLTDPNFVAAWQGCQDAASKKGDRCIHIGVEGMTHPRHQVNALTQALKKDSLDALAIAVTHSEHIARALQNIRIPVITFDSPFNEQHKVLSKSYVGINNVQVGRDIATIAKKLYPNGGKVCLMTVVHDPNHALRLKGIRQTLSGNRQFSGDSKLTGEQGWYECSRSPWNTADNIDRTMDELIYTLRTIQPNLLIVTGHWPVIDAGRYRQEIAPYQAQLTTGKTKILVTLGEKGDADQLLNENLIHGYAEIDFYSIGQQSYRLMRNLIEDKSVPDVYYVPSKIRSMNMYTPEQ